MQFDVDSQRFGPSVRGPKWNPDLIGHQTAIKLTTSVISPKTVENQQITFNAKKRSYDYSNFTSSDLK